LKTLLSVLKNTIQVKENAEISQERIQSLIEKIEQIEINPTEIAELTAAIEQLVIYIQKIPRTDLNPILSELRLLSKQIAAIPTSPPSKPDLSNLATKQEVAELTQSVRQRENILLGLVAFGILLNGVVTMWSAASSRDTLKQQVQQVPKSIQQYQIQQQKQKKSNR
jgi:tRNA U34 5-methylaminomethyl-2-thiouridine-forming methyltransferase MnmC